MQTSPGIWAQAKTFFHALDRFQKAQSEAEADVIIDVAPISVDDYEHGATCEISNVALYVVDDFEGRIDRAIKGARLQF